MSRWPVRYAFNAVSLAHPSLVRIGLIRCSGRRPDWPSPRSGDCDTTSSRHFTRLDRTIRRHEITALILPVNWSHRGANVPAPTSTDSSRRSSTSLSWKILSATASPS